MERLIAYSLRIRFGLLATALFLIPFVIDGYIHLGAGPETRFRFFEYLVLLSLVFSIPRLFQPRPYRVVSLLSVSIGLFALYLLGHALVDPHWHFALDCSLQSLCWLLFALLVADVCESLADYKRLLFVGILVQIPMVLYALGQIFRYDFYFHWIIDRPDWTWINDVMSEERSIIFVLGNPNYYASYASFLLLWLGVFYLDCQSWRRRLAWGAYIALVAYTLIYTFARGVWLSLAVAVVLFGWAVLLTRCRRVAWHDVKPRLVRLSAWGVLVIALVTSLFVMGWVTQSGPLQIVIKRFHHGITFRDTSLRARPLLWYAALEMWYNAPVWGNGNGQYGARFIESVYDLAQQSDPERIQQITRSMNTLYVQRAHNDYLQYLAETGIVGYSLLLLLFFCAVGAAARRLWRRDLTRSEILYLSGSLLAVLYTAIQCVFDFPLRLPASSMFFSLALGGILLLTRKPAAQGSLSILQWILRGGCAVLILVLASLGSTIVIHHLLATHLTSKAFVLREQIRGQDSQSVRYQLRLAEEAGMRARELYPDEGTSLITLGQIYYSLSKLLAETNFTLAGDYRIRAIRYLEEARGTFTNPVFYHLLCNIYLDSFQTAKAYREAEILRVIDPKRKDSQLLTGRVARAAGRFEDAVRFFKQEIANNLELRTDADNDEAYRYLGNTYEEQLKEFALAEQAYQRLLRLKPNVLELHERLANLYAERLNQPAKALYHYKRALFIAETLGIASKQMLLQAKLRELEGSDPSTGTTETTEQEIHHE
ncbi:MAG: O-antigen ligase family protein [bacterium]|jgi:O-antigen ligase|nr:O-antigen ligase family protein [bacterium]